MTVFKTFLKVLNKNKAFVILYTAILLIFAGANMSNQDSVNTFNAEKPDIYIKNEDENIGLTQNFIEYLTKQNKVIELEESKLEDALFYRDVNIIVKIPKNYRKDLLNGLNPKIEIKSTGDYQASLAKMNMEKYLKVQSIYQSTFQKEEELIKKINETIEKEVEVNLTSTIDSDSLSQAKFYFNFANYAILAGLVYVVSLILSIFKEEKIRKRTTISSMNYKLHNKYLFLSNGLFALGLWAFYVILSFVFVGNILFSTHGIFYILNSFLFTICALAIAFFIGSLIQNKDAVSGIVNVLSLGSSFLCGAFVPAEFLPKSVLTIAHILPSYWYINTNEVISSLETFDKASLEPVIVNFGVLLAFTIFFAILTNFITKRKQKQ